MDLAPGAPPRSQAKAPPSKAPSSQAPWVKDAAKKKGQGDASPTDVSSVVADSPTPGSDDPALIVVRNKISTLKAMVKPLEDLKSPEAAQRRSSLETELSGLRAEELALLPTKKKIWDLRKKVSRLEKDVKTGTPEVEKLRLAAATANELWIEEDKKLVASTAELEVVRNELHLLDQEELNKKHAVDGFASPKDL